METFRVYLISRQALLLANFPINYSLHSNPKQHRSTFENFVCINLFLMKHQHSHEIQSDEIMLFSLHQCTITHHLFISMEIDVSLKRLKNKENNKNNYIGKLSILVSNDPNDPQLTNQAFELVLDRGTRYIVVDCGGGTVDITVHELDNKMGTLKELYKATGGPYGSVGKCST